MRKRKSLSTLLLDYDKKKKKTEMLTVGPALQTQHFDDLTITPDTCVISLSLTAKDIGVMFQPTLPAH